MRKILSFIFKEMLKHETKKKKRIFLFKVWLGEKYTLMKDKRKIKNYTLSNEQKKQIDVYWKKNYGKKISYINNELYLQKNGNFSVKYIPEAIYTTKIEPMLNDYEYGKVYSNKSLLPVFLKEFKQAEIICYNSDGLYFDKNRNIIEKEVAISLLRYNKEFIIKPSIESGGGRNVQIIKQIVDYNKLFEYYNQNFVIQKIIKQSKELDNLYDNSINTIRIMTYIVDGQVKNTCPMLRIGSNKLKVDNWTSGGLAVGIDAKGRLKEKAFNHEYEIFKKHPNSNIVFYGYQLKGVEEAVKLAKCAHLRLVKTKVVSWDFTIGVDNTPILIEANLRCQGTRSIQLCNGPLFGDDTSKVLNLIRR